MEVQAAEVIEAYRRLLTEANHQIAFLQAQVAQLQRQETPQDAPPPAPPQGKHS